MPEFENLEQAAQALADASAQDAGAATPPVAEATPASPEASSTPEADAGATSQEDSFTNIDPNTLPPELQALYKNMQGDYTRKTQELAPLRELQAQGVDLERATQALQFVEALETDPQFLSEVHGRLSAAMEQMGMTPAQAQAAATQQIQEQAADPFGIGGEDEGESALAKEVAELRDWREQQEAQQAEQYMAFELQKAESAIRQANPEYTDTDIERLYELAFAHGGDLQAAQASYQAIREQVINSYVNSKGAASEGAPVVTTGGGAGAQPTDGYGEDLDAAHKGALAYLANSLANQ